MLLSLFRRDSTLNFNRRILLECVFVRTGDFDTACKKKYIFFLFCCLRFCSLKLDQFTLPGSHNAGAGFDSGFGFFNCWVRNQHLSVLEQLRMGIRFLDVDPSWEHCGLLGTYHSFMCGGPICRMLKQVR